MRAATQKERAMIIVLSFFSEKSLVKRDKEGYINTRRGGKWLIVVLKVNDVVDEWENCF